MKLIRSLSILLCAVMIAAVTVGCSAGQSYWQTYTREYEDSAKMECFAGFDLTPDQKYEVWINVSDFEEGAVVLFGAKYSFDGTGTYCTTSVTLDKEVLKATNGWLRLQKDISKSYDYIDVSTKYAMHINEVIACDGEGNIYKLSFKQAGERISRDSTSNRRVFKDSEYEGMKNPPQNACDAQDAFDRATVFAAYKEATGLDDSSSS